MTPDELIKQAQNEDVHVEGEETEAVNKYLSNNPDLNQMNNKLNSVSDNLSKSTTQINTLNSNIDNKRQRLIRQESEIGQKRKIILTRNRMLNISEANNRYNQKLIYTFVSIIFGLFILMLVLYVYNNKKYIKKGKGVNSIGNSNTKNS
jgi:chromosome segregation ATPase